MVPRPNINFDAILEAILSDMAYAVRGWSSGQPRDETALMNWITGRLSRNRRRCDVGIDHAVEVVADFFALHRRGENQTDQFGSDVAVTIRILDSEFTKTAFFQLKVSNHYKASVSLHQLKQAAEFRGVLERSFVLAVDDPGCGYRIQSSSDCVREIGHNQDTKQFDTAQWEFLSEWVVAWFGCQRGLPSDSRDPHAVEHLLHKYKQAAELDTYDDTLLANLPREIIPAKSWLSYTLNRRNR